MNRLSIAVMALLAEGASAESATVSFGFGAGLLPARQAAARAEMQVADTGGQSWSWAFESPSSFVAPGFELRGDVRWKRLVVGLTADAYLSSFANEANRKGRLYGALISLPVGLRFCFSYVSIEAFGAPFIALGGFGLGTFGRIANAPIEFGQVRFYDDETALHMVEASGGLSAGINLLIAVTASLSVFVTASGLLTLFRNRSYNIAGYSDEAQSEVKWVSQPLSSSAVRARLNGSPLLNSSPGLDLNGLRMVIGLQFQLPK
jgi:hypothetical protein